MLATACRLELGRGSGAHCYRRNATGGRNTGRIIPPSGDGSSTSTYCNPQLRVVPISDIMSSYGRLHSGLCALTFRLTLLPDCAAFGGVSLQTEDDAQGRVNAAHFVVAEKSDALAEPARIYCCDLFGKYPGTDVTDFD